MSRASPAPPPADSAGPPLPAEPRRILIVRLSHLGDVAHALPLYHRLAERWPRAELSWAVQPAHAALVEGLPRIARAVRFERGGGPAAWWRLARELRALAPDVAVDAQGNLKSAAVLLASGARMRLGLHPRDWREPLGARALTAHAPPAPGRHAVERVAHLASWITGLDAEPRLDPDLSADERARGAARLEALVGAAAAPVAVQLGPPGDPRSWTEPRYAECVRALVEGGRTVVVLAGPAEAERAERLRAALPPVPGRLAHVRESAGPRATAALLAAVAERSGRFVGTDSGPIHLAASLGLPTVLLWGPQDPARTGPWPPAGGPHRAVTAEPGPACRPCLRRRCDHPDGPVCTAAIDVARVVACLAPDG